MRDTIRELGGLCKMASKLERKWDRAGKDYLATRVARAEYTMAIMEYLSSVRRLEAALSEHLITVTNDIVQAKEVLEHARDEHDHGNPSS